MPLNYITPVRYGLFVIDQLAPMPQFLQKEHIEYSIQEEMIELEIEQTTDKLEALKKELIIWETLKPTVKFLRKYGNDKERTMPNKAELLDFFDTFQLARTLDNGSKIVKTFAQHARDIRVEIQNITPENNIRVIVDEYTKILKELGDVLFFVVAADMINYSSPNIKKGQKVIESFVGKTGSEGFLYTLDEIRQANYEKLYAGKDARYKNGYNANEDFLRKNQ